MKNHSSENEKKSNPRQNANVVSILTYWWTLPIFLQGLKKELNEKNLFKPLKEHASSELANKLEDEWNKEQNRNEDPSLYRALFKVFGLEMILYGGVYVFIEVFCKIPQSIALLQLLTYVEERKSTDENYQIYVCAGVIVGSTFCNAILAHYYSFGLQHLGMKIRVACCSLIYRKSLRMSNGSIEKVTIGHIINLLSNDVNRFDKCACHAHSLWFVPIETMIIVYVLYSVIGITSTVGVFFTLFSYPLQVYLCSKAINLRWQVAEKTDKRVQLINEIISGIRIIKMYTWENYFSKLITFARKLEIIKIRNSLYIKSVLICLSVFSTRLSIYAIVLTNILLGNALSAKYVFVATSLYNILKQGTGRYFIQAILQVGEARTSIERIRQFLMNDEVNKNTLQISNGLIKSNNINFEQEIHNARIRLENVSATWASGLTQKVLNKINLNIVAPKLIAITGPVGSGKSSLLKLLLKELKIEEGCMSIRGNISYCSQNPWLFVGTIQQNILFTRKLNNKKYKEVIEVCCLVDDFAVFPLGDQTIIGERGVTLSGGQRARINLARTLYNDTNIYLLDDPLSSVDVNVGKIIFEKMQKLLKDKCTILITHQTQYLDNISEVLWMNNGHITKFVNNELSDQTHQVGLNEAKSINDNAAPEDNETTQKINHSSENKEENQNVYFSYFKNGGTIFSAFFMLLLFILSQISASGSDYFITYWINTEYSNLNLNLTNYEDSRLKTQTYLYVYSSIISFMVFITLLSSCYFINFFMKASTELHNTMFSNVIGASLNFFDTRSSGRILNRFSKDMGTVDETIPTILKDCLQTGLNVLGIGIILVLVKPWMLIVNSIILTVFCIIRKYYLITSCNLKRLEAHTRSTVFTHANASLQGILTVRAFGAQRVLHQEFDDFQDIHTSAWFLFLSSSTAFGFWLELICVIYIAIVAFLVTTHAEYSGHIGLAITQALSLMSLFQFGMRQWGDLENQMTSVERIQEYGRIEQEINESDVNLTDNWPTLGAIKFCSVSLKYPFTNSYALRNLNFSINSGEKIGIIGRTGAGKSSIISAILRLVDFDGDIIIDNINIRKIHLKALRSQITIIPQESILFSGTLRKNLDPFDEYSDFVIWEALEEVELKETVDSFSLKLEEIMRCGDSKFSSGQIQLLCLSRAILRKHKIIILDEATANLDSQTDALIQKTIKSKFKDSTVLTIAHRLDTIMEADRILVVDYGSVVEFDYTDLLLQNKASAFYKMVHQSNNDTFSYFN